jgi:D-arginine dehydrogenase
MQSDFLIIGGGIAGVSTAARLSHHGKVTLLEAESNLAHHASGRSAALYEPHYGAAPVVDLSLASGDYFRSQPNILTPRGIMILGRAHEDDHFNHDIHAMDLPEISFDEARAIVPILNPKTITRAATAAHAWDIDTDLLLQNFAREAKQNRADFHLNARATAIQKTATGWRVTTATGTYDAAILINAAGAWADPTAAMAGIPTLGFQPMRRSMARIPAPGGHDVTHWPMMFGCGETWYAKPDAGALIVSPAEEDPMDPHDAWADDMVLAEGLARYEEFVTEPVTKLISNWAGLRTFSPDRVLVIGADASDPSFFWLAGQGGYGFQSCPAASQLACDLIIGQSPQATDNLLKSLSPARFT